MIKRKGSGQGEGEWPTGRKESIQWGRRVAKEKESNLEGGE